ncbi:MAG: UPF0149 family protein [Acidovorax sp.]
MTDAALTPEELHELDDLLDAMRAEHEETPQWEFCDGFLTALACTRRDIPEHEYWAVLLDADPAERFVQLWRKRAAEVARQLDTPVESLDDERTFQPDALDVRAAVLALPEDERAGMEGEIPSFGQIWALGFMYAVESWPEEWAAPRDKEAAGWIDDALDTLVALTEDDTGAPEVNMADEDGPPSVSQARVELFGEAIWAVYDLRQVWKSLGPRVEPVVKGDQPGRNDPCPCGSGKKFKKCHGA